MENQEPRTRARLAASIVLAAMIGAVVIGAIYLRTSPTPSNTNTSETATQLSYDRSAWPWIGSAQSTNGTASSLANLIVANITIGGFPDEISVDPNTNIVYIADDTLNKLTVVDLANDSVMATVALPGTASPGAGFAVDTATNMVYVPVWGCTAALGNVENSCFNGGAPSLGGIVAINGTTDKIVAEYHFDTFGGFALNPNTGVLFGIYGGPGTSSNSTATGSLLEINGSSGSLIANVPLGALPLDVAINTETNTAYVLACKEFYLNCAGTELLMVNATSGTLQSVSPLGFGELPFNLVVDTTTNVVYTMMEGPQNLTLVAIDGASGGIDYSKPIGTSCGEAGALAIDSTSDTIYATAGCLLVIDAPTGLLVSADYAGGQQFGYVAFNPTASQVYVTTGAGGDHGYLLVIPASAA